MRIYWDTEFSDLRADAQLISAGFVTEHGKEFYAEVTDVNKANCSAFVKATVLPLLDAPAKRRYNSLQLGLHLIDWLAGQDDQPVLMSDSHWDADMLHRLLIPHGGLRVALPGVKFQLAQVGDNVSARRFKDAYLRYFKRNPGKEHHALHDARALKDAYLAAEGFY